jgi:LCP family protein required for cell wall assembly
MSGTAERNKDMQVFGSKRHGKHTGTGSGTGSGGIIAESIDSTSNEEIASPSSGGPSEPPSGKKPGGKKGWKIVGIIFLVLLAIAGAGYAYWHFTTKPPDVAQTTETPSPDETENPVSITDNGEREVGRYYTLLLVGKDAIGANTDTIMLMRYDAVNRNLNVYSIPRDTLVDVPYSVKKINGVYFQEKDGKQGGIDALMNEVEEISGFRPDNYVVVDVKVVAQVIDTLGGVDFDVPVNMNYDDPAPNQNLHIHINKGMQHLSGENFVKVFRFRATYAMGDIDRINVQHDLIKAALGQWLKLGNIDNLFSAAKILVSNAETDLSYGNMQWYAQEFLKMDMSGISLATMPGDYSLTYHSGSYVGINVDEWLKDVNLYLNPMKAEITKDHCQIVYKTADGDFAVTDGSTPFEDK